MYTPVATRYQILKFISGAGYIKPMELAHEFGYSEKSVKTVIERLHQRRLIDNKKILHKWNLTEQGERKLEYYQSHQEIMRKQHKAG